MRGIKTAGLISLLATVLSSPAEVIYQYNFTGDGSRSLIAAGPDVVSQSKVWAATRAGIRGSKNIFSDGRVAPVNNNRGTITLPVKIADGAVYRYSVSYADFKEGILVFGFSAGTHPGDNSDPVLSSIATLKIMTGRVALFSDNAEVKSYTGSMKGKHDLVIELDTTGNDRIFKIQIDGKIAGTYTNNTSIGAIVLGYSGGKDVYTHAKYTTVKLETVEKTEQ